MISEFLFDSIFELVDYKKVRENSLQSLKKKICDEIHNTVYIL